jgi:CHAT domain-containing protein/tetratricopeptide (TPR) repeat protein
VLEQNDSFQQLDCYAKGKIYHKIGLSHYLAYQEEKAVDYFSNKVLALWENCSTVAASEKANTIYNLGICYQYLGNNEEAKGYLDEALDTFENDSEYPSYQLGLKYHGVGLFYEENSDFFRSQLYFSSAIDLFEKENAILEQFDALNDAITLHTDFKDYDKASDYVAKALMLAETYNGEIPFQDLALVYLNAATIYYELKKFDRAHLLAEQALQNLYKEATPQFHAIGLEVMAFLHMEKKEFKKAEDLMHKVLNIRKKFYQENSGLDKMALTYENFSELYLRKGDLYKAEEQLKKGFALVMPFSKLDNQGIPIIKSHNAIDDRPLIRLLELKTRIYEKRYQRTKDVTLMQHSLNVQHKIDSVIHRGLLSFQFEQSKLDFASLRFEHYGKAIKDALHLYELTDDPFYLEEAYLFSARTKALTLQQELNRINALESNVSGATLQEEKDLRQKMNKLQTLLYEANESSKDSLQQLYLKSQSELDLILREIEEDEPDYYKQRYEFLQVPTVEKIQRQIPKDLAVVEFFVSDKAMYSFWITKDGFFSQTSPFHKDFKTAVTSFVDQCNSPLNPISESLSREIFKQTLQEGLNKIGKKIQRLCIIPDGPLHSISFEALSNGNTYLIEDYAISYAYAAALLDQGKSTDTEKQMGYVGFGTEYSELLNQKLRSKKRFFGDEILGQLTMSKKEIEQAAAIFQGITFINDQATLDNFSKHANKARIVHLSLHGLVDFNDPHRSCIIFDDSGEEYLLSPQDLYQNRLKAELVLLSACHSASGKIYQGEGVQGMSRAFLLGGARNILSSLWNASEASSLQITTSFLENIKDGYSTDRALRQGKLDYLKTATPSQKHPYYWANFIILGEVDATSPNSKFPYVWILLLVLTLFLLGYGFLRKRLNTK